MKYNKKEFKKLLQLIDLVINNIEPITTGKLEMGSNITISNYSWYNCKIADYKFEFDTQGYLIISGASTMIPESSYISPYSIQCNKDDEIVRATSYKIDNLSNTPIITDDNIEAHIFQLSTLYDIDDYLLDKYRFLCEIKKCMDNGTINIKNFEYIWISDTCDIHMLYDVLYKNIMEN